MPGVFDLLSFRGFCHLLEEGLSILEKVEPFMVPSGLVETESV